MFNLFISFVRRKILRINKDRWDFQYACGQWEGLKTNEELERIHVAHDLIKKYHLGGNILEIGCGEGIFFTHIDPETFQKYEGIDISEVAIMKTPNIPKSIFVAADMENYQPQNAPFDTIVLNEVLYYSQNPIQLLKRYKQYLSAEGFFLIGMFILPKSEKIWQNIEHSFKEIEIKTIENSSKVWVYKILKPKL